MEDTDQKKFHELFKELLSVRNLNIEKLHELSAVPRRYLTAFFEADFKKLPAAPYVRGYLEKISEIIGIDSEELWQAYKNESESKTSGPKDYFPSNRFAIKTINKKKIFFGIIAVFVIIYLTLRVDEVVGIPQIEIIVPTAETIITSESIIKLSGTVNANDKLMINGEEILVESNGHFEKNFILQPGRNIIEFKAKRFLGKEITASREVIYNFSQ
ncbi:MAG: helix-turn-helix domain-containing protein [Patescibacteria group bacterium]|mgnify:CR=1 FL=1